MKLKWLLGFRKLRSSKKVEILQVTVVLRVVSWKKKFFHGTKKRRFFPYFHHDIIFFCAKLFECTFNFKFCWNIFIFLNINTNQTSKDQDLNYKKQSLILGAAIERCFRSVWCSGLQLYFRGVFEDFGHILLTCSKKFINILELGKIFRC